VTVEAPSDDGPAEPAIDAPRRVGIRVLLVAQGPPARGGIPSFVEGLLADPTLRREANVEFLNTTRSRNRHPGAASVSNLREGVEDVLAVARLARTAQVVHLNTAAAPALPLARTIALAAAARLRGARVVVHAHTGRMHRAAASVGYRLLLRLAVRVADAFVVVSRSAEETVIRVTGLRPRYVPNGVDASSFRPRRPAGQPTIAFVGTVCERKGIVDLADSLERLRERGIGPGSVRVVVIGDAAQEGPGVFRRVRDEYRRRGLMWVEFTGALPRERVAAILAESSVFCLPSHWEGFPISVLEAMASGCAVVATSVGEIPSLLHADPAGEAGDRSCGVPDRPALDDGPVGLVVPVGDAEALADALERLVREPAFAHDLGVRARERIEASYSSARVSAAMLDLYRSLRAPAGDHSM
jgi:glycosyltransferase involved in cell wall biosynthesis